MRDTDDPAARIQVEAIRRIAPTHRLAQALELSESVRRLALARVRAMHPDRSTLELVELLLGKTLVPTRAADPPA